MPSLSFQMAGAWDRWCPAVCVEAIVLSKVLIAPVQLLPAHIFLECLMCRTLFTTDDVQLSLALQWAACRVLPAELRPHMREDARHAKHLDFSARCDCCSLGSAPGRQGPS